MARSRFSQAPGWQKALAIACVVYALFVWALPAILLPIVNVLPFVHESTALGRLPASIGGTAVLVLALVVLNRAQHPVVRATGGSKRGAVSFWGGVVAGFAMFTYAGAALSANLFGLAAKLLPHEPYRARVAIESAEHSGSSRYKSVTLQYEDPVSGERRYLVFSKRLFDYPEFRPGDVVELRGRSTVVGVYVDEFALLERASAGRSGWPAPSVSRRGGRPS